MPLHERIIAYIERHHPLTLSVLEGIVVSKGFTLDEFESALERVHRDKRIVQSTKGGDVVYSPYIAPPVKPNTFASWSAQHYPRPGQNGIPEFVMPFPEIDMSYIFMTPEELDEYKAKLRGKVYVKKKRYERKTAQNVAPKFTDVQIRLLSSYTAE